MNIAMEQTEEYVNGQLKNKYGDAFIRGNNGNNQKIFVFFFSLKVSLIAIIIYFGNNQVFHSFYAVLYISTSKRTLADGA